MKSILNRGTLPSSKNSELPNGKQVKSQQGFTLIEAMIVIAIIGILAAMSTVGFTERIRRDRLDGAANMAAELLSQASMMVKKENANFSVKIHTDSLSIHKGIDCVADNLVNSESVPQGVRFGGLATGSTGLPSGFTVSASTALNSGWNGDCINFLRINMGNSVFSPGLLGINHLNDNTVGAAVIKTNDENRFQTYLFRSGEWVRR